MLFVFRFGFVFCGCLALFLVSMLTAAGLKATTAQMDTVAVWCFAPLPIWIVWEAGCLVWRLSAPAKPAVLEDQEVPRLDNHWTPRGPWYYCPGCPYCAGESYTNDTGDAGWCVNCNARFAIDPPLSEVEG